MIKQKSLNSLKDIDMDHMKLSERSSYAPIITFIENLGFTAVQELSIGKDYVDILVEYDKDTKFVIEIKISKKNNISSKIIEGIVQAYKYAEKEDISNIVVIVFPGYYRKNLKSIKEVKELSLELRTDILTLNHFWIAKVKLTLMDFFIELKNKIEGNIKGEMRINTLIDLLQDNINAFSRILEKYYITNEEIKKLINVFGENYKLFLSLGNFEDIEKFSTKKKFVVIDLISYLILNQILFYMIYSKITGKVDQLKEINKIKDLKNYFKQLTDRDYKPIYQIDVISKIPDTPELTSKINDTIKIIDILKPESIKHDLLGRLFHKLLPNRTRKILSAFYTGVSASEVLSSLVIKDWRDTIWDISCGSGTLLVSAYRTKKNIYPKYIDSVNQQRDIHKLFIEEHITGTDIMPFACHLAGLNLSAQNLFVETQNIRISKCNSLDLLEIMSKENPTLKQASEIIGNEIDRAERAQKIIEDFNKKDSVDISEKSKINDFKIKKTDVILMNPPFTDRHKMPEEYRTSLSKYLKLSKKCGNKINLWGYFLALADEILKENGRIGAIVPINFLKGEETQKIRDYFLNNYSIKYIIKPIGDFSFSEDSSFKDIMFAAEKTKAIDDELTCFIFMKEKIKDFTLVESKRISEEIRGVIPGDDYIGNEFEIHWVKKEELIRNRKNLMPFIYTVSLNNKKTLDSFITSFINNKKLLKLDKKKLKEGINSPKGLSQLIYITRPLDDSRIKRSFLILEEEKESLLTRVKGTNVVINIDKKNTVPALRTLTGIKNMDVTKKYDFVINNRYEDYDKILSISKWKKSLNWRIINKKISRNGKSRLIIPDKINLSSRNTMFLSLYSDKPLSLSNVFFLYKELDKEKCKILCLSLNSILTLCQFIKFKSETLGSYMRLNENDWSSLMQLNPDRLTKDEKEILNKLLKKINNIDFPPLLEQLENHFWARMELDRTILKILGFTDKKINKWLPKIYDVLSNELKAIKKVK